MTDRRRGGWFGCRWASARADSDPFQESRGFADDGPVRRFDPVSAFMALAASFALVSALWLRFGPPSIQGPPAVGSPLPTLRLIDPETSEPLVLMGLRGKIIWLMFWSPGDSRASAGLADLESCVKRFRSRDKFALTAIAAAAGESQSTAARSALAASKASFPMYLAAPQTLERFGTRASALPLHVLADETGTITLVAQGGDPATLARVAAQAGKQLDALAPLGDARFAWRLP